MINATGIDVNKQILIFERSLLEDGESLADYEIKEESILILEFRGEFPVFVNLMTEKTLKFIVEPSTKIKNLKILIRDREGKLNF